jgi:hypothetical protein
MTRPLDPQDAEHLIKLLGMLGSKHDGEIAAAGRKAHEFVRRSGLTWGDVIYQPPTVRWQSMAQTCQAQAHALSMRKRDFIRNISRLHRPPTDKQLAWLESIFARLHDREAAA